MPARPVTRFSFFAGLWLERARRAAAPHPAAAGPGGVASLALDELDCSAGARTGRRACARPGAPARRRASGASALPPGGLDGYRAARHLPGRRATSRLSPHLRFGEISPRQVWHAAARAPAASPATGCRPSSASSSGASSPTTCSTSSPTSRNDRCAAASPAFTVARRPGRVPGLVPRPDRLPDRRRRHARALAHRLHAQPRADGRGLVPDQAPAARPGSGGPPGSGTRCATRTSPTTRMGWQWVAGSGADGARLLPHARPGRPGPALRPRRRLRPALGAGAGRPAGRVRAQPVDGAAAWR